MMAPAGGTILYILSSNDKPGPETEYVVRCGDLSLDRGGGQGR